MNLILIRNATLAVVALGSLAACGDTPGQRGVSGGLLGAGGGAAIGAATGGNPLTGAVIGGVGGAAVGALTAPTRRY